MHSDGVLFDGPVRQRGRRAVGAGVCGHPPSKSIALIGSVW
jgi:hypothetical protein